VRLSKSSDNTNANFHVEIARCRYATGGGDENAERIHRASANGEELNAFAPGRIESGFRYSPSYSVSDLKILEDHGA
jgi:hypothetical protein